MSAAEPRARLAVVAVTHNSAHIIPDWIAALESAVADRDQLELCVVDSGSSPDQRALIEDQSSGRVDHVVALPNVGYGAGCNAGARATSAPVILFANPDVQVRKLPSRALDGHGLGGAVLSGFALSPMRPLGFAEPPGFRTEAEELALARWSHAYQRSVSAPAWVSGAALMIERSDFDRIGGFSPAFFMYFEDADLCMRHRYAGGHMELDEELVIEHGRGESSGRSDHDVPRIALDGVNRLSGRRFAARYGRPWDRAVLYLLLVTAYAPRRALVRLFRERWSVRDTLDYLACLLRPSRALRKLTSPPAR